MGKTANLYARIEPEIKENAEEILKRLGIPTSNAINMFYKQIILHRGIPFDVKLPELKLMDSEISKGDSLDEELQEGYREMIEGRTKLVNELFEEIRKEYEIWSIKCKYQKKQKKI